MDAAPDAALDAPAVDAAMGDVRVVDAGGRESGLTGPAARGEYLVKNVLGCVSCHTPRVGGTLDNSKLLSGVECFAKDTDGGCLNSTNLTNDSTGLKTSATFTTTIAGADGGSTSKDIQSLDLTPDSTGIKGWTPGQIVAAIKSGKDDGGRTLCSPMRTLPGITDQDTCQ